MRLHEAQELFGIGVAGKDKDVNIRSDIFTSFGKTYTILDDIKNVEDGSIIVADNFYVKVGRELHYDGITYTSGGIKVKGDRYFVGTNGLAYVNVDKDSIELFGLNDKEYPGFCENINLKVLQSINSQLVQNNINFITNFLVNVANDFEQAFKDKVGECIDILWSYRVMDTFKDEDTPAISMFDKIKEEQDSIVESSSLKRDFTKRDAWEKHIVSATKEELTNKPRSISSIREGLGFDHSTSEENKDKEDIPSSDDVQELKEEIQNLKSVIDELRAAGVPTKDIEILDEVHNEVHNAMKSNSRALQIQTLNTAKEKLTAMDALQGVDWGETFKVITVSTANKLKQLSLYLLNVTKACYTVTSTHVNNKKHNENYKVSPTQFAGDLKDEIKRRYNDEN